MNSNNKSLLNAIWKIGVGIIGLIALGITVTIVCILYQENYGRCYYNDHNLSKYIKVVHYENDLARVKDLASGRYITPKLKWVAATPLRDSITVYCDRHDRRGFIDCNTGKIIIPAERAKYRRAWQFSDGLAFVVLPDSDSLSVIDHDGKVVFPNVALFTPGYDYIFVDGVCTIGKDGKYGLLAKDGTWAVEQKYDVIGSPNKSGYRIALDEEGYWLFDTDLNLVFDRPYDKMKYADGCENGHGDLFVTRNHVKQLVNYDGTVVEPFVVDITYSLKYMTRFNEIDPDEYEIDPDLLAYEVDGWTGLMNRHTGKAITPAIYNNIDMISKDLIKAELGNRYDSESVILDKSGRVVKQTLSFNDL